MVTHTAVGKGCVTCEPNKQCTKKSGKMKWGLKLSGGKVYGNK